MKKSRKIRNFLFQGHRYLGLFLGILIAIRLRLRFAISLLTATMMIEILAEKT